MSKEKKDTYNKNQEHHYLGKRRWPVTVGAVRLDRSTSKNYQGPYLSSQPTRSFIIPMTIGLEKIQVDDLLDSGASTSFLDRTFAKRHNIMLQKKSNQVQAEVIDGRPIVVSHETMPIEIIMKDHTSRIMFNIIDSPLHSVIFGISWIE